MKNQVQLYTFALAILLSTQIYGQVKIMPKDFTPIFGNWEGTITYLDYQSNEPYTMTANLVVEQGKDQNRIVLNNIYPNEPKANNSSKIKVSKNGTLLNKNPVTAREELADMTLKIQTEHRGKDDNKKALIRSTYLIGEEIFSIKKDVQFVGTTDWIKRSEFKYFRAK